MSKQFDIYNSKLQVRTHKKKTYVIDGFMNYQIQLSNNNPLCMCLFGQNTKSIFCKHSIFYLHKLGFDIELLDYWHHIKSNIIKMIDDNKIDNTYLWKIIDNEILNIECGFCLEKIINKKLSHSEQREKVHFCSECKGITHEKCYKKWDKKNAGCMLCRGKS